MQTGNEREQDDVADEDRTMACIRVDCDAGPCAVQTPRRFFIGTREIRVTEVIDRWLDPHHSHFKVRGDDGGIYILRQVPHSNRWEMILYNSGRHAGTRLSST